MTLTLGTEVENLSESGALVGDEEQAGDIVVVRPENLRVRVQLLLGNWLAPISLIIDHVLTVTEVTVTDGNVQAVSAVPNGSLGLAALMGWVNCHCRLLSRVDNMHLFVLGEHRDQ